MFNIERVKAKNEGATSKEAIDLAKEICNRQFNKKSEEKTEKYSGLEFTYLPNGSEKNIEELGLDLKSQLGYSIVFNHKNISFIYTHYKFAGQKNTSLADTYDISVPVYENQTVTEDVIVGYKDETYEASGDPIYEDRTVTVRVPPYTKAVYSPITVVDRVESRTLTNPLPTYHSGHDFGNYVWRCGFYADSEGNDSDCYQEWTKAYIRSGTCPNGYTIRYTLFDPNDDYYCLSYIDKDSLPTDILDENTISEAEYEYNVYCSLFKSTDGDGTGSGGCLTYDFYSTTTVSHTVYREETTVVYVPVYNYEDRTIRVLVGHETITKTRTVPIIETRSKIISVLVGYETETFNQIQQQTIENSETNIGIRYNYKKEGSFNSVVGFNDTIYDFYIGAGQSNISTKMRTITQSNHIEIIDAENNGKGIYVECGIKIILGWIRIGYNWHQSQAKFALKNNNNTVTEKIDWGGERRGMTMGFYFKI